VSIARQVGGFVQTPLRLFTLLNGAALLFLPVVYDRYLEVLLPGAACAVAARFAPAGPRWGAGILAVVASGLISIGLVHDWLSWNSARWDLGRQALAHGIIATDIEGGFEWNGWFGTVDPARPLPSPNQHPRFDDESTLALPFSRIYFPQVTGRFALTFTPLPNSAVVAAKKYSLWLSSSPQGFLFVRHIAATQPPAP
jgi:hypothetical protein